MLYFKNLVLGILQTTSKHTLHLLTAMLKEGKLTLTCEMQKLIGVLIARVFKLCGVTKVTKHFENHIQVTLKNVNDLFDTRGTSGIVL